MSALVPELRSVLEAAWKRLEAGDAVGIGEELEKLRAEIQELQEQVSKLPVETSETSVPAEVAQYMSAALGPVRNNWETSSEEEGSDSERGSRRLEGLLSVDGYDLGIKKRKRRLKGNRLPVGLLAVSESQRAALDVQGRPCTMENMKLVFDATTVTHAFYGVKIKGEEKECRKFGQLFKLRRPREDLPWRFK